LDSAVAAAGNDVEVVDSSSSLADGLLLLLLSAPGN
jgi:hypothetical protein